MAGHSHSSNIKHRKDSQDALRGKVFTKLGKAITIAARSGGDPDANPTLRHAIDAGRAMNMPKTRIEKAILRGTGEGDDASKLESLVYEGYGAGGVAVLAEVATDNRNRTAGEIRKIFDRAGGQLGATGCVGYMFETKGLILVSTEHADEDELMELTLEAGADDFNVEDDMIEILTEPQQFHKVREIIAAKDIPIEHAAIESISNTMMEVEDKIQHRLLKLMASLEDNDDVVNVYHNCVLTVEDV